MDAADTVVFARRLSHLSRAYIHMQVSCVMVCVCRGANEVLGVDLALVRAIHCATAASDGV